MRNRKLVCKKAAEPQPPFDLTADEIAVLNAAYQEWLDLYEAALASGDQQRIDEVAELGK